MASDIGPILTNYVMLKMQFNWQGTDITPQGIHDNTISGISSNQLKRMQNKNSILEFF